MIVRELFTRLGFRTDASGARQYEQKLGQIQAKAEVVAAQTEGVFRNLARNLAAPLAALGGAQVFQSIVAAADDMTSAMNRLNAAMEGDRGAAEQAFEAIYSSARETGIAVNETASAFLRMAPSMRKLGHDTDATVEMLDGLQKGLLAAGSTSAEAGGVLRQLGQGIMAAKLNGDELVKMMEESSPTLLNTFAEAVGTTVDKLKEMGSDGKLTADVVLPALMKAARAGAAEFARMDVTVGLATSRSRVALTRFLAEFDKAIGLSRLLTRGIQDVGRRLDEWRGRLGGLKEMVDRLGGLEAILRTATYALGLAAAALLYLNRALVATAIRTALAFAPWVAGGLAITAVAILLDDFVQWTRNNGTRTLFEEWFGPWEEVRPKVQPVLDLFNALVTFLQDQGARGFVAMHDAAEEVSGVLVRIAKDTQREWEGVVGFFNETVAPSFARFRATTERELEALQPAFAALGGFLDRFVQSTLREWANVSGFFGTTLPQAFLGMMQGGNRSIEGMRPQIEWLLGLFRSLLPQAFGATRAGFEGVVSFFRSATETVAGLFEAMGNRIAGALTAIRNGWEWVRSNVPGFGGGGGGAQAQQPGVQQRPGLGNNPGLGGGFYSREEPVTPGPLPEEFRNQMRDLLNLGGAAGGANLAGAMTPPARGPVNQSQQNVFNNNITVQATGTSGAEVAQGAARGVDQATARATSALREVQAAMPIPEAASQ